MSDAATHTPEHTERWQIEAAFFDQAARGAAGRLAPMSSATLDRYRRRRRRVYYQEFRLREVGCLRGKRVLDVGCGDGINAVLLASLGARVDGLDISPEAIALARRRAEVNGVSDDVEFFCAPLETADFADGTYDVIWCDAFLHHLIPDLESTMCHFRRWLAPGGMFVITEPVNLSAALRRLRFALATDSDHTPDERPLERAELDVIARTCPEATFHYFRALGRLTRYLLPHMPYESAAPWRKAGHSALSLVDWLAFSRAPLHRLASVVIVTARVPA